MMLAMQDVVRDGAGRFIAGHSGNAGGRPRDEHKVAELARSYTSEAIDTLVSVKFFNSLQNTCRKLVTSLFKA